MELIALLSTGKGSWGQVAGLINKGEWANIILIGSDFAEKFSCDKKHEFIKINSEEKIMELRDFLKEKLKEKIKGMEVALSIASGEGKEHMALISALLSIPVGIRLVVLTQDGILDLTKQGKSLLEKDETATFL